MPVGIRWNIVRLRWALTLSVRTYTSRREVGKFAFRLNWKLSWYSVHFGELCMFLRLKFGEICGKIWRFLFVMIVFLLISLLQMRFWLEDAGRHTIEIVHFGGTHAKWANVGFSKRETRKFAFRLNWKLSRYSVRFGELCMIFCLKFGEICGKTCGFLSTYIIPQNQFGELCMIFCLIFGELYGKICRFAGLQNS